MRFLLLVAGACGRPTGLVGVPPPDCLIGELCAWYPEVPTRNMASVGDSMVMASYQGVVVGERRRSVTSLGYRAGGLAANPAAVDEALVATTEGLQWLDVSELTFRPFGREYEGLGHLGESLAMDSSGNVYYHSPPHHSITRIEPDGSESRFAGQPNMVGYTGDGGPASDALLSLWNGPDIGRIEVREPYLYIADFGNSAVRRIDLDTEIIETVAGGPVDSETVEADPSAYLYIPTDVAVGPDGSLYVAEPFQACVHRIDPDGTLSVFAGVCGERGDAYPVEGQSVDAPLYSPEVVEADAAGNVFIADYGVWVVLQ